MICQTQNDPVAQMTADASNSQTQRYNKHYNMEKGKGTNLHLNCWSSSIRSILHRSSNSATYIHKHPYMPDIDINDCAHLPLLTLTNGILGVRVCGVKIASSRVFNAIAITKFIQSPYSPEIGKSKKFHCIQHKV